MKLFLDTANLDHIKEASAWGVIDGVTTNPSLMKKAVESLRAQGEDIDMESYIKKICAAVSRTCPVSLEVGGLTEDEMVDQGMVLYETFDQVAGNVVIKIPVCPVDSGGRGNPFDGIRAINRLTDEKIPVNATLVFTPEQALLAAKAGADYVSPFLGRLDDRIRQAAGMEFDKTDHFPPYGIPDPEDMHEPMRYYGLVSGSQMVESIVTIFREYGIEAEIIAASIRNAIQVRECAEVGAHIATIPHSVLLEMINHPATQEGIDGFTRDLVEDYTRMFEGSPNHTTSGEE